MINFHSNSEFFSFFIVFLSGFPLKGCKVLENDIIFQNTINDFQKFSSESNICLCPAAAFFDSFVKCVQIRIVPFGDQRALHQRCPGDLAAEFCDSSVMHRFVGVADSRNNPNVGCQLFGGTEILDIADHCQKRRSTFCSDSLHTCQVVKTVQMGTVIFYGIVQFFNTLVQTPDLIHHNTQFYIGYAVEMISQHLSQALFGRKFFPFQVDKVRRKQVVDLILQHRPQLYQFLMLYDKVLKNKTKH